MVKLQGNNHSGPWSLHSSTIIDFGIPERVGMHLYPYKLVGPPFMIAKLLYNYGPWFMMLISTVIGVYEPTSFTGDPTLYGGIACF